MEALLTREAILASQDIAREQVSVPEWGGSLYISVMTGEARDAWEQSLIESPVPGATSVKANLVNVRARLVAYTAIDEQGNRLFSNDDVAALGKKSGRALERCAKVAQRLNGLTDKDLEAAKGN